MNKAESGLQLLSRLDDRPLLTDFDKILFPSGGPFPKEVVEITGNTNTGKTILLTELIAKAILPLENGGHNAGVILLNTDHHFQIMKLVTALEKLAKDVNNISDVIQQSLKNLYILQCFDDVQFSVTIKRLDSILAENSNISMLALDSISAYYWSKQNLIKIDTYYRNILKVLQNAVWEYKVTLFYTRPSYFFTKNSSDNFSDTPKLGYINYRALLDKVTNRITINTHSNNTCIYKYMISEKGFECNVID